MQPNSDYPRMARRLRARLGDDLHQLHDSLQQLAHRYDQASARQTVRVFDPMDPPAYFAAMVRSSMTGSVLTYSSRLHLLKQAHRLGIGRFQANLIIAAVQHQTPSVPTRELTTPRHWPVNLMVVAAIQAIIVVGLWMILSS